MILYHPGGGLDQPPAWSFPKRCFGGPASCLSQVFALPLSSLPTPDCVWFPSEKARDLLSREETQQSCMRLNIDELYCYVLTKNAIAWACPWHWSKEAATNLDRYSGTAPHSVKARISQLSAGSWHEGTRQWRGSLFLPLNHRWGTYHYLPHFLGICSSVSRWHDGQASMWIFWPSEEYCCSRHCSNFPKSSGSIRCTARVLVDCMFGACSSFKARLCPLRTVKIPVFSKCQATKSFACWGGRMRLIASASPGLDKPVISF